MIEVISHPDLHKKMAGWVANRVKAEHGYGENAKAIGVSRDGVPVAAVVYHSYTGHNITCEIAVDEPAAMTRRVLRELFSYPFVQLNCLRITVLIARSNTKSIDFCQRLGFVCEGTLREATPADDYHVYGMLKRECPWIKK
jgi:RimJ/RimL family protein N-acetyltransferase